VSIVWTAQQISWNGAFDAAGREGTTRRNGSFEQCERKKKCRCVESGVIFGPHGSLAVGSPHLLEGSLARSLYAVWGREMSHSSVTSQTARRGSILLI